MENFWRQLIPKTANFSIGKKRQKSAILETSNSGLFSFYVCGKVLRYEYYITKLDYSKNADCSAFYFW